MQTNPTPPAQRIGVPRETFHGEKRVATVPDVVEKLVKLGFSVAVESGAGDAAHCSDEAYRAAGAEVLPDAGQCTTWASSPLAYLAATTCRLSPLILLAWPSQPNSM